MQLNMTKGKPLPVILMFTVPLIIGNVFQQLYNMVDTIIVGRYVGADALAAVGSTGTIHVLITGFLRGHCRFFCACFPEIRSEGSNCSKAKCGKWYLTLYHLCCDPDCILRIYYETFASYYEYTGQYL